MALRARLWPSSSVECVVHGPHQSSLCVGICARVLFRAAALPWGTWLSSFFAAEPTEEVIVGQDALDYVDRDEGKRMRIFYPTEEAQVKENGGWEAMKILLDKILHDLGVADKLDKCLVFLTEPPYSSNQNRVNFMRMILDRKTGFGCGGFFMGTQAILAKTGFDIAHPKKERVRTVTVLDVGDGLSHVIPVVDNVPQLAQAADTKLAGRHVTTAFETILRRELGVSVETSREHEAARLLKQAVAVAPQDDAHKERIEAIRVPDGPPALVKYLPRPVGADLPFGNVAGAPLRFVSPRARWLCGDILFNPASAEHILYMHRETKSVVHIVDKAISDSPVDARNDLRTILLSGGTTLMEGFAERLAVDVNRLQSARFPRAEPCRVLRDPLRHILVYRGAVYVCKQIKFQAPNALDPKLRVRTWMTQSEYEDRKDAGDKRLAAFFETKTGVRATNLSGVARAT